MSACFTEYTHDRKREDPVSELDVTLIRAVTDETAGMLTGTGNEVQIKRIHGFIIKILRNMVVVFCFNCYHKNGCSASYVLVKAEVKLWSGRFLLF